MTYARLDNGSVAEYPVFAGDIMLRLPNTSFPNPFQPPDNYVAVAGVPQPPCTYAENIVEATPQKIDGTWTQIWDVVPATPEQIEERTARQADEVRTDRNKRLAECDWTQLQDSPLDPEAKAAWAFYRENLRMVPQQPGFPWNVQWPPQPGAN